MVTTAFLWINHILICLMDKIWEFFKTFNHYCVVYINKIMLWWGCRSYTIRSISMITIGQIFEPQNRYLLSSVSSIKIIFRLARTYLRISSSSLHITNQERNIYYRKSIAPHSLWHVMIYLNLHLYKKGFGRLDNSNVCFLLTLTGLFVIYIHWRTGLSLI